MLDSSQTLERLLWTRVDPQIRQKAERVAKGRGTSLSEYLRDLILSDLEARYLIDVTASNDSEVKEIATGQIRPRPAASPTTTPESASPESREEAGQA